MQVMGLDSIATARPALAGPALLFDMADGSVLYAEDQDTQWHPASLTKIMTAYVTFVAIKEGTLTLETKIGCSKLANNQGPTTLPSCSPRPSLDRTRRSSTT